MGAIILATLLEAAPADVRAEFEHLDYAVPGETGRELEEYGEVLVAAQEAARVTELLRALGAGADELRKVSSVWGDSIRNASCRTLRVARRLHSISERNTSQRRFRWGGAGHDCVYAGEGISSSSSGALGGQSVQVTLAMLLEAAPADAHAEFEHLGSCVLGDLAAAQAGVLTYQRPCPCWIKSP